MPRQETANRIVLETAPPKTRGEHFFPRLFSALASCAAHAVFLYAVFFAGSGGEAGLAVDGGGAGAVVVGIIAAPGSASGMEITHPAGKRPGERAEEAVGGSVSFGEGAAQAEDANGLSATRARREETARPDFSARRSVQRNPAPPRGENTPPGREKTASPFRETEPVTISGQGAGEAPFGAGLSGATAAVAGEGGGGGSGEASAPGTEAGDGKPFGFPLSAVSVPPKALRREAVVYPREAREKHLTGYVLVRFHLDAAGKVSHLSAESASPPGVFEENVLAAVRRWRFAPAKKDGKAVPVWVEMPVEFHMRR